MTWNCRIIYHDKDKYPWFGVHEVYYNAEGEIYTYTIEAMDLTGETEAELKEYIDMIQRDVNRAPILIQSEVILPVDPNDDDPEYEEDELPIDDTG
jgi:hypothetical protein